MINQDKPSSAESPEADAFTLELEYFKEYTETPLGPLLAGALDKLGRYTEPVISLEPYAIGRLQKEGDMPVKTLRENQITNLKITSPKPISSEPDNIETSEGSYTPIKGVMSLFLRQGYYEEGSSIGELGRTLLDVLYHITDAEIIRDDSEDIRNDPQGSMIRLGTYWGSPVYIRETWFTFGDGRDGGGDEYKLNGAMVMGSVSCQDTLDAFSLADLADIETAGLTADVLEKIHGSTHASLQETLNTIQATETAVNEIF